MLTKSQLAGAIDTALQEEGITIPLRNIRDTLTALGWVAEEEIAAGSDFTVPGVARLAFSYRAPQKKGAKYKKGDSYVGFGGIEQVAEADSKPVAEQIRLRATPTGPVARLKPGSKPEAQSAFIKSSAGKAVKKRKAK